MEEGGSVVVASGDAKAVFGEILDARPAACRGRAGVNNDVLVARVNRVGVKKFTGSKVL